MAGHFTQSALDLDCLWGVIESSMRIRKRYQLFSWAQGILQSVLRHDLLICANAGGMQGGSRNEIVAPAETPAHQLALLREGHPTLVVHLARLWSAAGLEPFLLSLDTPVNGCDPAVRDAMLATGLRNLAVHGSFDRNGSPLTLFAFGQIPDPLGVSQLAALEILVPYLHVAFLRIQIDGRPSARTRPNVQELTGRELEILRFLQGGFSNTDIGRVLEISPLTVKNHVQKILRKLHAQNRTEAVAKGLNLEILQVSRGGDRATGELPP
jgi:transcriptional regulator EpsA